MKTQKIYTVTAAYDDLEHLEKQVNAFLIRGWQLQGGIAVVRTAAGTNLYYQALTKEE